MARNGVFSQRRWSEFSPSDSQDVHVLAVDDSLIDRKVIERLLKITSCKVTAVDSGRRALQFLGLDEEKSSVGFDGGLKVDMIITDYCMPGMTGYELLKKIKGSTFREVPVVIMSSENVLARIDRCLEEGAEDFIVKPVKLSDVKRLKGYMFGEDKLVNEDRGILNKRKLQEMSGPDPQTTPPPPPPPPPPISSSSPPSESLSSSSSLDSSATLSSSSPSPQSSAPSSPPCSPSLLTSPTRRLKMTNCEIE